MSDTRPESWPVGIITVKHMLSPEVAERIRRIWEANFGGPDKAPRVLVFEDGMGYIPLRPLPPEPAPRKDRAE